VSKTRPPELANRPRRVERLGLTANAGVACSRGWALAAVLWKEASQGGDPDLEPISANRHSRHHFDSAVESALNGCLLRTPLGGVRNHTHPLFRVCCSRASAGLLTLRLRGCSGAVSSASPLRPTGATGFEQHPTGSFSRPSLAVAQMGCSRPERPKCRTTIRSSRPS
jgi:hypothetical protein